MLVQAIGFTIPTLRTAIKRLPFIIGNTHTHKRTLNRDNPMSRITTARLFIYFFS